MERKEYPSSDKHYSGTSVSNQNQSRELATLTSANKVDSMLVVLQGIHKVCEKLACWSAHLLKRNLDFITYTPYLMIFAILTEFSAVATLQNYLQFSSRQLFRSPLAQTKSISVIYYHDSSSCVFYNTLHKSEYRIRKECMLTA